jgi:hypothetical protein
MEARLIEKVIADYEDPSILYFLRLPNRRSIAYSSEVSISKSIENIIKNSLQGLSPQNENCFDSVRNSDTLIFPDVHGRLDLFLQNLYVAGLIDNSGNWCGDKKTAVLLGDLIHIGPFSTETLIYTRALQEQAKEVGGKFEVLLGNHEHCLLNNVIVRGISNVYQTEPIKKIILENIRKGNTTVAYADDDKNIFCTHAGVEKEILKWAIRDISPIRNINPSVSSRLSKGKKVSSEEISIIMRDNNIKLSDVAKWMNIRMKEDLSWNAPLLVEYPKGQDPKGVINSRKKCDKADTQDISRDKILKMVQFVGHTTTSFAPNLVKASFFGAVKKVNHNFYTDYDLVRGNRGFVALYDRKIYQISATKENGLDIHMLPNKIYATVSNQPFEALPWVAKKLNVSAYTERHIATLPSKSDRECEAEKVRQNMLKKNSTNNQDISYTYR